MNLNDFETYKTEVLKCEIGTLLFNLGKTHVGFWNTFFPNEKCEFTSYKNYYEKNYFDQEILRINPELYDFIKSININFPPSSKNQIKWEESFKGNISSEVLFKKIFFKGCENINSGIDKGAPKQQLKSLWISNAFGSFKKKVDVKYFDRYRKCFFINLDKFLDNKCYYARQNNLSHEDWSKLRDFVVKEIKEWYSHLLSDTRFPVNDVTLWDQAYMSASMFKATLSSMILSTEKDFSDDNKDKFENPSNIKWSILGIQYDKLALAEKGLKPAHIKWYREASYQVDEAVKSFFENKFPLGNEVYRDETGIYFIVGDNICEKGPGPFYKLNTNLSFVEEKISDIFSNEFSGEVYPAVILTKPSRGLMTLSNLLDKSKENFLKSKIPINFTDIVKIDSSKFKKIQGICQVCGLRPVIHEMSNKVEGIYQMDYDYLLCETCKKRRTGRIDKWIENRKAETIWTGEVQDKNGKIALVTLKFELDNWLNGNLFNSLLIRKENFINAKNEIKNFISLFIRGDNLNTVFDTSKEVKNTIECLKNERWWKEPLKKDFKSIIEDVISTYQNKIKSFESISVLDEISFFPMKFAKDAYDGCKNRGETFDDFIDQILFNPLVGTEWEELVKKNLSEGSFLEVERKINWEKLNDSDIDYISNLLVQYMLRKNPSPARLKRTWDSTKIFFEEMQSKMMNLLDIPEERRKRLFWENSNLPDGEYYDGDIDFWVKEKKDKKGKNVYLITSIEKIENKKEFNLKSYDPAIKNSATLKLDNKSDNKKHNKKEEFYLPYFPIIDPTPISWQFAIPADRVPFLLENIEKEYFNNFRWVYGKLPLHVGIIVQNYKKPLYVAIKASRKIRRDNIDWKNLRIIENCSSIKQRQQKAFNCANLFETTEGCKDYYSLLEKVKGKGAYDFYLYFDINNQIPLGYVDGSNGSDSFYIYPNTFDFEFLETNTRRNDIYYDDKGKRVIKEKLNRPYDLEDFKYFKLYKNFFDKKESGKPQKLVSLIYSKLKDWSEDQESIKIFFLSAFINVLDLKTQDEKNNFASILKYKDWQDLSDSTPETFIERLYLLLDMFDFYHNTLDLI